MAAVTICSDFGAYIENYKTLMKEIKDDTNREKYTTFMDQKNQYSENEYTTQRNL